MSKITLYLDWGQDFTPAFAIACATPVAPVARGMRRWRVDLDTDTLAAKLRPAEGPELGAHSFLTSPADPPEEGK